MAKIKQNQSSTQKQRMVLILSVAMLCIASFLFGMFFDGRIQSPAANALACIRLKGYTFISPLLTCNTSQEITTQKTAQLRNSLSAYIQKQKDAGTIGAVSVYIREFNDGSVVDINPSEMYYPASLDKVVALIAALKMNEKDGTFLSRSYPWTDKTNYNKGVLVQPQIALKVGQQYTIKDAIQDMIQYSDNNAFIFLLQYLDPKIASQTFSDLNVPRTSKSDTSIDYVNTSQIASLFRVLRNATYLSQTDSEYALQLLSKSEFTKGLRAGIPSGVLVADKFGISSGQPLNTLELHDCGIVYVKDPYLICVMSKGSTSLQNSEDIIKTISSMAYSQLNAN